VLILQQEGRGITGEERILSGALEGVQLGASALVCVLCCEGRDRRWREGVRGGQFKRGRGRGRGGADWWKGSHTTTREVL
jgi:hypothetical protein